MVNKTKRITHGCITIRYTRESTALLNTICDLSVAEIDNLISVYESFLKPGDNLIIVISNNCDLLEDCVRFILAFQNWVTRHGGMFVLIPSPGIRRKFDEYGMKSDVLQADTIKDALNTIQQRA